MAPRRAKPRQQSGNVAFRILSYKRSYYIGYLGVKNEFVVDEAVLDVEAVIERTSARYRQHVGLPISVRLIHSERYASSSSQGVRFFGSISLQRNERYVLAYLPAEPFWALPDVIRDGAQMIVCSFEPMKRGHGDLLSLYFGREEELANGGGSDRVEQSCGG